jgi:hypothetical protein
MNDNGHQRAHELAALPAQELAPQEQCWLQAHLASCESCQAYAHTLRQLAGALRSIPIPAGFGLVQRTRVQVHWRAHELRRRQEALPMIWACVGLIAGWTVFTMPWLWKGLTWIALRLRMDEMFWPVVFLSLLVAPIVATSFILISRGAHLGREPMDFAPYAKEEPYADHD